MTTKQPTKNHLDCAIAIRKMPAVRPVFSDLRRMINDTTYDPVLHLEAAQDLISLYENATQLKLEKQRFSGDLEAQQAIGIEIEINDEAISDANEVNILWSLTEGIAAMSRSERWEYLEILEDHQDCHSDTVARI